MINNEKTEIKIERSQMPSAQPKKVLVKKPITNVERQEKTSEQSIKDLEILDDRLKQKQQEYEEAKARILKNQTLIRNQQKYNLEFPELPK
ncbi:unnamed protein product [Paramecium sonneborni]|uniref:Uncharacterized protein n=1 Tax=Paramecium sonneborni TaxID=65129 RepID=A0A8S1LBS2_9CILI|nr:unnamed protein product [Paramecium sonneborni]CAD8063372.1 unnamed protein product [Paramecium sonneborni]